MQIKEMSNAILYYKKTLKVSPNMAKALENRIKLYWAGRPYRQTRPGEGNN